MKVLTAAQVIEKLSELEPTFPVVVHNGEFFVPVTDVIQDRMLEEDGEYYETADADDENCVDVITFMLDED